jgi:SAM-dependent methyltransferase
MKISLHQEQILKNKKRWAERPLLQRVYLDFYRLIPGYLSNTNTSRIVELGSGLGNIQEIIPSCLRTDLFPNPWIDQVENAYALSFPDGSVSDLILMDVFHHFRYPGMAMKEFSRVLQPGGRVIIFDPCLSLLGLLVYGLMHPEPVALFQPIEWLAPAGWSPDQIDYYAAQGNALRVFGSSKFNEKLEGWKLQALVKFSAISYIVSGGYSGPQLYPDSALPYMKKIDRICDRFPLLFATRLLVALEKAQRN